ncbi:MAG: Bifunctional protein HldE [Chlamydiales bacterium]|nr:Bifunctional protein HldE [Chlamydiales bacterium]
MVDLQSKKILVAGDLMLDVYTLGEVQRISPEAPVPVLRVTEERHRPGGAGNAILNLISLGMEVIAMGRIGQDRRGQDLLQDLAKEDVDTLGIVSDSTFQTPIKNRMMAAGQQIVRVDHEHPSPLSKTLEKQMIDSLPKLLEDVDVVAISDYAKGFLTPTLLTHVIKAAKKRSIPVIVDPKGLDFSRYQGVTVIKPNLSEAIAAAGLGVEATLDEIAQQILQDVAIETLLITRSKEGMSLFSRGQKRNDFPAEVHEIVDVTGAGDTVLAVFAAALANQLELDEAVYLANIAAGIAIERIGCARISLSDLMKRAMSKVF